MPFGKYDCVLVPGFQFGGMEHPGVILYNASRTFLSEAPTDTERLYRTELISHETAHLWFGDAVTMRWFDDVWTKEVFANYFAARITEPLFPETDFRLRNFQYFNIPAYAEDRTAGTHPIRQRLDNLKDAGLVYGNIVYDKAPVVMRMLADTLGTEAFQAGMREYLETYLYRNATWPELIDILDRHTAADLKAWSHRWVEEAGMPHYTAWTELPNLSALGYGYYEMSEGLMKKALHAVLELDNPHERLSTLANLYENMLHGNVPAERMTECLDTLLSTEKEPLIASAALGYLDDLWHRQPARTETLLHDLARNPSVPGQIRLSAFRKLVHFHADAGTDGELFSIWRHQAPYPGLVITAEDYTTMAFELAIRRPQDLETLRNVQRARIDNPDRQARFDFVFPSVHPDQAVRDSVFQALLQAENRHTDPIQCQNTAGSPKWALHGVSVEKVQQSGGKKRQQQSVGSKENPSLPHHEQACQPLRQNATVGIVAMGKQRIPEQMIIVNAYQIVLVRPVEGIIKVVRNQRSKRRESEGHGKHRGQKCRSGDLSVPGFFVHGSSY